MRSRRTTRIAARAALLATVVVLMTSIGLPGLASADSAPVFPQCPAAGADTGCGVLITVNPDGSTTVATDPAQPPMSPTGVLVGIVNNSDAVLSTVSLNGTAGSGAFDLTGQGVCDVRPRPCFSSTQFGPTGYEGPGTSFVTDGEDTGDGTIAFAGGMSPGGSTYFSLASAPFTVTSASLTADVSVAASPVTAVAGVTFTGQVATFTEADSTAPLTDFAATVDWGDGTTSAASITQAGGTGTPYAVSGSHVYPSPGTYATTVSVTDDTLVAISDAGSDSSTAVVTSLPTDLTAVPIPAQVVGTPYSGPVATFTDPDLSLTPSSFAASIDWGAESGGVEQVSAGSITQPGGPGTPFDVAGANTYAESGDFTVQVSVSFDGVTNSVSELVEVDIQQVTVPCSGNCTGEVTTPLQTSTGTTNSPSGSLSISIADGSLYCGTGYDYAPQVTTVTTNGVTTGRVTVKVTFPKSELLGAPGLRVGVCFAGSHPFVTNDGTVSPQEEVDGQLAYVGLLRYCARRVPKKWEPCLVYKPLPRSPQGLIHESIGFFAGDPKFR